MVTNYAEWKAAVTAEHKKLAEVSYYLNDNGKERMRVFSILANLAQFCETPEELLAWIESFRSPKPQHVFVVHGDREVAPFFAQSVVKLGFTAHAPQYTEVYDLIADQVLEPGYLPERKTKAAGKSSSAYERLVAVGNPLMESIKRSKGRDNKSLARFADQLRQLLEKWES